MSGEINSASPQPPRSKQAINELLNESGAILDVVEKSGIPSVKEWNQSITTQNPYRICLDLDSSALQAKIRTLANKMDAADKAIASVFENNSIDQVELNKAFASPTAISPAGFASAGQALQLYATDINFQAAGQPTCENLIRTGNLLNSFTNMVRNWDEFSRWVGRARDNLSQYRDNLRKELRNAN
jgi:hypothetical protein